MRCHRRRLGGPYRLRRVNHGVDTAGVRRRAETVRKAVAGEAGEGASGAIPLQFVIQVLSLGKPAQVAVVEEFELAVDPC